MSQYRNQNFTELKRVMKAIGGEVTGYKVGTKHFIAYGRTPKGNPFRVTLGKGPQPAGHVEFYAKKRVREADRNHGGYGNGKRRK